MDRRLPFLDGRARASLAVLATLVAAFWLWGSLSSEAFAGRAVTLLETYSQGHFFLSAAVFVALAFLSVLLGPLTSAPIVPIAVLAWGEWVTFGLLLFGWVGGGALSYGIGRLAGETLLIRFVPRAQLDAWQAFVSQRTTFFTAFLFRLAMPAETGYAFGLVRYDLGKFLLLTVLVEIPFALTLVFGGNAFATQNFPSFAGWIASAFLVLSGALYLLKRQLARTTKPQTPTAPERRKNYDQG